MSKLEKPKLKLKSTALKTTSEPKPKSTASTALKTTSVDDAIEDLLGCISQNATEKPGKKSQKPIISLNDKAEELLELQRRKAEAKSAEGRIRELEAELLPAIEEKRKALNIAKQEYVGSIYVAAKNGEADAGQVLYVVQHRYSGFNPKAASKDSELNAKHGGKASQLDEAIEAISAKLGVDREKAAAMLKDRMDVQNNIAIQEGALKDPEVIAILKQHLAKYLIPDIKMKPNKGFSERSNYDKRDIAIMEALQEIGLCLRAKASIRSAGDPDSDSE